MHRIALTDISAGEVALAVIIVIAIVNVGILLVLLGLWLGDRREAGMAGRTGPRTAAPPPMNSAHRE